MNYWLVKSEPNTYSWDDFKAEGSTVWSGIRNYAARNHLRDMKKGDEVLFYHSGAGKDIVGIAKVMKEHYQDPTTSETAWLAVDLKPFKKLKKSVTLEQVKKDALLKKMLLVTISRLSVMPVKPEEYNAILNLGL